MNKNNLVLLLPRIVIAFILLQTLYFKFGIGGEEAMQESKEIFGMIAFEAFGDASYEPYMRIGTGILELVASILLLLNATAYLGAILGAGLMGGAILSHLLFIGIEVRGDNGQLFIIAVIVLLASIKVLFDEREKLLKILGKE
jgi:uncharacterized membrane protein YphA (DoxX/SURF4 family)